MNQDIIFRKNCVALEAADPGLFRRLCLPVNSSHVRPASGGTFEYLLHRHWSPMTPSAAEIGALCVSASAASEILVFGVGEGDVLKGLLESCPAARITAWERDPWLLRVCLGNHDFSPFLQTRRLRFSLGADIMDERSGARTACIAVHPFFGALYRRELELMKSANSGRMALIREGALFIDDFAAALAEQGFGVYTLDMETISREEMRHAVEKTGACVLASVNYRHMLAEFCFEEGLKLLCWEIDPSLELPVPPRTPTGHAFLFSFRRGNVARYAGAGFANVSYLPLAANTRTRAPAAPGGLTEKTYGAPVSFVGASMADEAAQSIGDFIRMYEAWAGDGTAAQRAEALLRDILGRQAQNVFDYVLPVLLRKHFGEFIDATARDKPYVNLEFVAALAAASQKRFQVVKSLARFGIRIWGDSGWRELEKHGVRYEGRFADHYRELNSVYCSSVINLDIGRIYQPDIVTMRVFDVLACGGFVLAEHSQDLDRLFDIGTEIESWRTLEELGDKVSHFLAHPGEARRIAGNGRNAVLERHSMKDRFSTLFRLAGMC